SRPDALDQEVGARVASRAGHRGGVAMASVGTVEVERVRPVIIERRSRRERSVARRSGQVGAGLLLLGAAALLGRASANRPLRAGRGVGTRAGRIAGNI